MNPINRKNQKKYYEAAVDFEDAKELEPNNENLFLEYKKLHGIKFIEINGWGNEVE